MKRELFNVADEEFIALLKRTHEGFQEAGVSYMFVGGVANQLHIAKLLCNLHKDNLVNIVKSNKIRIQDYFRSTDDVDIVTKFEDESSDEKRKELNTRKKIFSVLDYIIEEKEYLSPTEEHIVSIDLDRRAHVRPVFALGVDGIVDPDKKVSFNIYRGPEDLKNSALKEFEDRTYNQFLERAVIINLPYSSNGDIPLKVKNKEDLIATKMALGRPKDINDVLSLVKYSIKAKQYPDYDVVREILCSEDERLHVKNEELCKRYEAFMKLVQTL